MNLLSFIFIFISTLLVGVYAAEDGIENIARSLGGDLSQVLENATNYTALSEIPNVATKTLEKATIESDIVNLTKLFNDRLSIAQKMAEYAEFVHENYTNYDLDESYDYFNAVERINDETMLDHDGFSDPVTLKKSAVQTPTDLYQYTSEILNSINWTKKLDQKFEENFENKSIKAWQYIGLSNGVYRFYPGTYWPINGSLMQYYDVRQRSWYIEGSTSPKDMVIILDLSGSVIGNRLLIIKSAVLKLLDTLQENDFVAIIYFNKNAHYLKKCWNYLVQATERNKKILKAAIKSDSVKGKNVANVETGFKLAFQTLEKARKIGASNTSNCTQAIAFFTDGVEGDTVAEDVFDQYNSKTKVRVFTYLVGRENGSPFEAVKWIACNNRGFFYRIETLSDVRQTMVKYVTVLSRSRSNKPKWTPLYLDALFVSHAWTKVTNATDLKSLLRPREPPSEVEVNSARIFTETCSDEVNILALFTDTEGLGMTSSLVVPIFDKGKKQLLGVLGSDVRLDEILSNFPEPHLGSGGYPFLITNNGLVFYHPLLEKEEGAGLKHPANVYISELLHHFDNTNKTKELAKHMINGKMEEPSFGKDDFKEFLVLAKYNDKFRIVKRNLSYSYDSIRNTSFSVGIAVTDYGSKLIDPKNQGVVDSKALQELQKRNFSISIAENWPYCSEPINNWKELETKLTTSECTEKSNGLIDLVKYDITKLGNQNTGWMPEKPNSYNVQAVFFGTTSGLTFYKSVEEPTFNNTSIKQEYFETFNNTSIKQEYFQRAADSWKKQTIIFSAASQNEVHASKAVVGKDVLWGVVGIQMSSTYLRQILNKTCKSVENKFCYLVDENGYVVSSEKEKENGEFFGTVEGNVMEDLINQNVYVKYNFTDVQATCEPTSDESSSSVRLLDPFFSLVNYAKWWTQTIALSLIQYSLYSVMTGTNQVRAEDDDKAYACFKKIDLYYRKDDAPNARNDSLSFPGCERSYSSSVVKYTNLLLVIVDRKNSTFCKKLTTAKEDDYEGSCDLVEHYRVPADHYGNCVPNDGESGECSSGKLLIPSIVLLVLLQIWLLMLQKE